VFSDQLASHYCVEMVREAFKKNFLLWSLPANTSHFVQPLDNVCFARLKQSIAVLASKIQFQGVLIDADKKTLLYSAIYHQEFEVWTPRLI
jgi:hypothetical protein